jgi:hypothetical protein
MRPMEHPDVPEPVVGSVVGIRWWRAAPGGLLRSPWRAGYRWHPGVNEATCYPDRRWFGRRQDRPHPRGAPEPSCGCGFYAMWDVPATPPADGFRMLWDVDPETSGSRHRLILGVVEGFGRVLLGTDGFRAQYVRPRALATGSWVPPDPDVDAAADVMALPLYRSIPECVGRWREAIGASRALART